MNRHAQRPVFGVPSMSYRYPPTPRTSFSALPLELRLAIWQYTITPRTLSIIPHYGSTSMPFNHPASVLPFVKTHPSYACSLTFTVAEGIHPHLDATPYWAEHSFRQAIDSILGSEWRTSEQGSVYSNYVPSVPKAPVALHVCRESRRVALQHYTLAFAGTNILSTHPGFTALFNASGLGLKRTWVDWEQDTIFVVHGDRAFVDMRVVYGEPFFLEVLAAYAQDEAEKIRRLAVAGHWSTNPGNDRYKRLGEGLVDGLKLFAGLEELIVYHSDVSWEDFVSITEEDDEEGTRRTIALVRRSEKQVLDEMVSILGEVKSETEEWTSALPQIEVSRDWQWCWRGGETLLDYCGPKFE
ncbi:hypothetical protein F5882DRAFT_414603 [Hyaloscypha sp. PMI_1271]|nr:hypothetical protein F5882DRAFT_414603 [Hyaloscypha sp. PMI_1271]